ncbi:MAG: hypothetical protein ABII72_04980 [Parcubacteria group bacterium]
MNNERKTKKHKFLITKEEKMFWYIVIGILVLAAAAVAAWYRWGRHKMPPPKCPGPPLDKRPCWCSIRGKETPKELKINRSGWRSRTFYLYGGNTPLQVEIEVETSDGRPWLVADKDQLWLPVGGGVPVEIRLASLDASLADMTLERVTAILRCITPGNAPNPEIKFHLDLGEWRELQIREDDPFRITGMDPAHQGKVDSLLNGQAVAVFTSNCSFPLHLADISLRETGLQLRQSVGPVDIVPFGSVALTLPLAAASPDFSWARASTVRLRAKVSCQGFLGVYREQPFTLLPVTQPGFNLEEIHAEATATATDQQWQAPLELPTAELGFTIQCKKVTLFHDTAADGQEQFAYDYPELAVPGGFQLTLDPAGEISLHSPSPLTLEQWPTGVGVELILSHQESGFSCESNHIFPYGRPRLLRLLPAPQPTPRPQPPQPFALADD